MRRSQKSKEDVEQILRDFENSGKTQKEFCQEHSIPLGTLNWWLKRKRKEIKTTTPSTPKPFIQVKPSPSHTAFTSNPVLLLDFPSGIRLSWFSNEFSSSQFSFIEGLAKL